MAGSSTTGAGSAGGAVASGGVATIGGTTIVAGPGAGVWLNAEYGMGAAGGVALASLAKLDPTVP